MSATDCDETHDLRAWLTATVQRIANEALGLRLSDSEAQDVYAVRLWRALETHFVKRATDPQSIADVEDLLEQLERGQLHYGLVRENVVIDVIVATGLERHENKAAIVFHENYMPVVRYHANRFAGQRGVDITENLAADLVLPRVGRPPKIATYRGLTPLKSWLRSVVVNKCVGAHRARREESLGESTEIAVEDTVETNALATDCESKLAPTFREAVDRLPVADRVLLKMLILDGVSQKTLAKTQGVDSGTLTRRRQKAAGKLLEEIQNLGLASGARHPATDCIELLLAGKVADLQSRLAMLLAAQFNKDEDSALGGTSL
ncbi:RNA polymerase sigma factor [Botrimarina hoheduenensis]|uniref:RNA polymerase sigma factor n=1 Tax=Botrimarina hoheduenensis TaxID=2528000 RepID=A0A5C5WAC9_9BACT|nr:sigma-70 family RNA polymerase sigma factor [Botrimarina hoheduenensis]TWT47858.1 RNA polymerase sigma factor [Botrimarina hoheduenensis]